MNKLLYLLPLYRLLNTNLLAVEPPSNGALIFTEHGSCLVSTYTKSSYSHIAIILYEPGVPIVFEAKPGGTIKSTYAKFQVSATSVKSNGGRQVALWIMEPKHPYSEAELDAMLDRANAAIGTPYSVIPTLFGRDQNTLQCAQYVSKILEAGPRFWFRSPKFQTPATLLSIVKPGYEPMALLKRTTPRTPTIFERVLSITK